MVPQSIEYTDPGCALLFAHIDRKTSGPYGKPVGGFRAVADAIGMDKRTLKLHAEHLAELGYIHLQTDDGAGNKSARMWIKCNPARMKCDHVHALPKPLRKRAGSVFASGSRSDADADVVQKMHHQGSEKCPTSDAKVEPVRSTENAPRPRYARMEGMEWSGEGVEVRNELGGRWIGHCDTCSADDVLVGYDGSSGFHACEPCMGRPF